MPIEEADAGVPQPHAEVWVMPEQGSTSQDESSAAPAQSTLPGDFTGDSGTKKIVATVAPTGRRRAGTRTASGSRRRR